MIFVPPERLQETWAKVLPGLWAVQRRADPKWIPEDIYHGIRGGAFTLYLGDIDGEYCGFIVLGVNTTFDGKELHIWCVFNNSEHDVLTTFSDDITNLARGIGAKRITFWSPRKWDRKIKPFGFEPIQTVFAKEL